MCTCIIHSDVLLCKKRKSPTGRGANFFSVGSAMSLIMYVCVRCHMQCGVEAVGVMSKWYTCILSMHCCGRLAALLAVFSLLHAGLKGLVVLSEAAL